MTAWTRADGQDERRQTSQQKYHPDSEGTNGYHLRPSLYILTGTIYSSHGLPLFGSPSACSTLHPFLIMSLSEKRERSTTPQWSDANDVEPSKKKPGQSWKQNEEHVLPKNNLGIVFFGLMSCTFLAALDQVCSELLMFTPSYDAVLIRRHVCFSLNPADYCGHSTAYHCR